MKKRILATVMTLTLGAAMLTACGSGADDTPVESAVVEETNNKIGRATSRERVFGLV